MHLLSLCPDINNRYLSFNPDLQHEARIMSSYTATPLQEHISTSCYFTAMTMRWLISDNDWVISTTTPSTNIYQIVFGETFDDDQHYITVFNNTTVYQSYWKNYPLTKTIHDNINDMISTMNDHTNHESVREEIWLKLTNVNNPSCSKYKCFYYHPTHMYDEIMVKHKLSCLYI